MISSVTKGIGRPVSCTTHKIRTLIYRRFDLGTYETMLPVDGHDYAVVLPLLLLLNFPSFILLWMMITMLEELDTFTQALLLSLDDYTCYTHSQGDM